MAHMFIEHENEAGGRKYPFAGTSYLYDTAGNPFPENLFLDAVLYPSSGLCSLTSLIVSSGKCAVAVSAGAGELVGMFTLDDETVELYDGAIHRGTIVLGGGKTSFLEDPTPHKYENMPFCTSCQFEIGANGVSSFVVNNEKIVGDVVLLGDPDGIATVYPVLSVRRDGDYDLRFDVVPSGGILSLDKTGIRKISILRQPGSMFNVLDRDGDAYLYLTRTGLMTKNSLITRADVCRTGTETLTRDQASRSSFDDCGSSTGGGSYTDEDCVPHNITSFLRSHDPKTGYDENGLFHYGFFEIPGKYGFYAGSTMTWFFVEGVVRVSMLVMNYSVLANVTITHTRAAYELFSDNWSQTDVFDIYLRHDAYKEFFDYFTSLAPGQLGYLDEKKMREICEAKGWSINAEDAVYPEGVDPIEFEYAMSSELHAGKYDEYNVIYTIRARDYFEHFECCNWEVSSADNLGNELRWLVGWRTGNTSDKFMTGGNEYLILDGKYVPKWLAARYVWWHKYCKNGNEMRHFIVPKERGLVIYTGDYYLRGDSSMPKETSPLSWSCNVATHVTASQYATIGNTLHPVFSFWMNLDTIRDRLHRAYSADYDPTMGDKSLEDDGFDLDWMDSQAKVFDNRVTDDTKIVQPFGAPVIDGASDSYLAATYPLGPFEYRYGRLYKPGVGYPETEEDVAQEEFEQAIKAPISFEFDITKTSVNAFNFDTTDMTAPGISYANPIHITVEEGQVVAQSMDVEDPTDLKEVSEEMKKLTSKSTSGLGIELSIPGLETT